MHMSTMRAYEQDFRQADEQAIASANSQAQIDKFAPTASVLRSLTRKYLWSTKKVLQQFEGTLAFRGQRSCRKAPAIWPFTQRPV